MPPSNAKRPSPALVVAMIALVAALGGTAVALPGKGTVDKNDIKKNAVKSKQVVNESLTGGDIQNESLTGGEIQNESLAGGDVQNNGLTGDDVDESTLGAVPSVEGRVNVHRKLGFGDDVELVANGPISVRAHCIAGDGAGGAGPDPTIRLYVRTTDSGTMMNGQSNYDGFDDPGGAVDDFVTPATAEADAILVEQINGNASETSTDVDGVIDNGWVVGADGSYLGLSAEQTVLGLTALGANGVVIGQFTSIKP